ncbi:MAG: thiamine/thiamine pyrophosphate ABC transporter permease ThiP [Pseudotabrizicola sp.]|uniref:thiamine/thiamine pyrophosphate ABC transporter permease ThiP n=1 Tax=Pseudotabrizicola sp. TaxID=2939647 RepID=UPI00272FCC45|nr:thiamine/thiamine pyrophosphate ABC transporter permease ThiP [Pseudotabrizicola sp.]MDP2083283.1 thiamine/thiamine pyrophosphate ABC transporter permease ThiP [Pseudotabrizicola sp.]MDZ7575914.1 thiamine/thiamine pyrophosphate ABC transporter permease ThiP [Pseudotabrizicola sp.]
MARGPVAVIGTGAAVCVAALVLLPLGAVLMRASTWPAFAPGDGQAVWFTLWQALVSAVVSCVLAVPVARALARRRFVGREVLITLMGAPFLLPTIVAVMGLIAVFGRSGLANQALAAVGVPPLSVYGAQGVILAHVFLNLPLAVRMVLQGWQAIPAERFRLAESLGFAPAQVTRHLEVPMLRAILPGAFAVIFVICLTSFAVALTLGGGPKATTVELAIYQAVRFDFDLGRAALLAGLQFALCALVAVLVWHVVTQAGFGAGLDRAPVLRAQGVGPLLADGLAIGGTAVFLLLPLGTIAVRGLPGLLELPDAVWAAAGRSVTVALASTGVTVATALALALRVSDARWGAGVIDAVALLPLATSGLVLGTGLFLLVQPWAAPSSLALPVTVAVNVAMSLPFVYRLLLPEARVLRADYGRLSESLGLQGISWLRLVAVPRLARPLGFGAGLAAALSMGDLGVIALFASDQTATLPLVVQRLMGAYRMDTAAGAALLLVVISFGLFWAFDWWGRRYATV